MEQIKNLIDIVDVLTGENGCPWDKEQTMKSLQPFLLEELHELMEAIDVEDAEHMAEETGDLLYGLIFLTRIAENEGLYALQDVTDAAAEKMIRRHPHIFGDKSVTNSDEVLKLWEEVKKTEGTTQKRNSILDGIPPNLPLLLKAQKIAKKISNQNISIQKVIPCESEEDKWASKVWELILEARSKKIAGEDAFRRFLMKMEDLVREEEKKSTGDDLKA